ncbi:MAG: hypothetical protein APF77_22495 [Clostridia bacterium BRH_c25]|nr:MAG: hypothetical protein APF77_22495 [Clostridia bacterium BRH_c25]
MKKYSFVYNNKEYELGEDNCSYVINDEEHPVAGIEGPDIIELLCGQETVDFGIEYYDTPCQNCLAGKKEKSKYFKFLEYHFFIFTKEGRYVISNISKEYEDTSFNRLVKKGIVDNSYVASVAVCVECGDYSIEIEQCDV